MCYVFITVTPARTILALLLALWAGDLFASDPVRVMPRVDTMQADVRVIVRAWTDSLLRWRVPMIPANDPDRHGVPGNVGGMLRNWFSPSATVVETFPPTILSVEPKGADSYVVRTMFGATEDAGNIIPFGIMRTTFRLASDGPHLLDPMAEALEGWESTTVGPITYRYPADVEFRRRRGANAVRFIERIAKDLGVAAPSSMTYILARDRDELCRILGVEYFAVPPSAIAYPEQGVLIVGNADELYAHELVHMVLGEAGNGHEVLREGVATLFGGSLGKTFDQLLDEYAAATPAERIPTLTQLFTEADRSQEDVYVVGAVVCDAIRRRHGVTALHDVLAVRSTAIAMQRCAELLGMEPSDTMVNLSDLIDEALAERRSAVTAGER